MLKDKQEPIRNSWLPYGRQHLDEKDIEEVCKVLRSDWLTTGPAVSKFEDDVCEYTGASNAVAVSSGTAALHAAYAAAGISPGDEVIVPAITFAATANAAVYLGAVPIFADINPATLLIDVEDVERKISERTRAIVAVDYAGQAADYSTLRDICNKNNLILIADAAHSLGGKQNISFMHFLFQENN